MSKVITLVKENQLGRLKWFRGDKGYGFIEMADGSSDVFLHCTDLTASKLIDKALAGELNGAYLEFDIAMDDRTSRAKAVHLSLPPEDSVKAQLAELASAFRESQR